MTRNGNNCAYHYLNLKSYCWRFNAMQMIVSMKNPLPQLSNRPSTRDIWCWVIHGTIKIWPSWVRHKVSLSWIYLCAIDVEMEFVIVQSEMSKLDSTQHLRDMFSKKANLSQMHWWRFSESNPRICVPPSGVITKPFESRRSKTSKHVGLYLYPNMFPNFT
jgi:hypothetical protein